MPLPTLNDVHVDRLQTSFSVAFSNKRYIADEIFPIVPVNKKSDVFASYDQSYWFRDEAAVRAPGTRAKVGGYGVTLTNQYVCLPYALSKAIPDEIRDNTDEPLNPDFEATSYVTDKILMRRENAFVADQFTTGVWTTDKTGAVDFTQWSNYAGSNPLVDLESFKDTVEGLTATEPNKLVVGKQVWVQLKWHPDVIDSIKYTQKGVISEDLFASLSAFSKLLVGRAIITTAKEGTAESSVTYSRMWGKHALMVYVPDSPALMTPSAGYTFVWNRGGNAGLNTIYRYRDDRARTDFIEIETYFDQKVVSAGCGLFMSSAVA